MCPYTALALPRLPASTHWCRSGTYIADRTVFPSLSMPIASSTSRGRSGASMPPLFCATWMLPPFELLCTVGSKWVSQSISSCSERLQFWLFDEQTKHNRTEANRIKLGAEGEEGVRPPCQQRRRSWAAAFGRQRRQPTGKWQRQRRPRRRRRGRERMPLAGAGSEGRGDGSISRGAGGRRIP